MASSGSSLIAVWRLTPVHPDGDPAAGSDEEHCGQFQQFHYLSLNNKMRESVTTSSSPGSEVSPAGVTSQLNASPATRTSPTWTQLVDLSWSL